MTRPASCCAFCAQIFVFYTVVLAPRQRSHGSEAVSSRCILLVSLEVTCPWYIELLPSASPFHVFVSFNSTFHFAILSCFNPAETFISSSATFVYIRVPPNNPINARALSLGPRLSLFSEVSYFLSYKQSYMIRSGTKESIGESLLTP